MVAGFHVFSMRDSDGAAPSLHTESALWIKNGPRPSSGSAFFAPPPVSSRTPRSSETMSSGCLALRAGEVGFELIGQIMHIDHGGLDAGHSQPVEHMIEQSPSRERHQWLRHAAE